MWLVWARSFMSVAKGWLTRSVKVLSNPWVLACIGALTAMFLWNRLDSMEQERDAAQTALEGLSAAVIAAREAEVEALERAEQSRKKLEAFLGEESTDKEWADSRIPESERDRMRSFLKD